MKDSNSDLALAFPKSVRDEAVRVALTIREPSSKDEPFSVSVSGETVLIPYRIYQDPALINAAGLTAVAP